MVASKLNGAPVITPIPTLSPADRAAHAAGSFVRRPIDRESVIAGAVARLESGAATAPSGQDPESLADQIREGAASDSSARRFAAFKLAQRIGGAS